MSPVTPTIASVETLMFITAASERSVAARTMDNGRQVSAAAAGVDASARRLDESVARFSRDVVRN